MNILFEPFPDTVTVEGKAYTIVTDFREWIKLSEFLNTLDCFTRRSLDMLLAWYIDEPPENEILAVHALHEFLQAQAVCEDQESTGKSSGTQDKPVFSFSQDAVCIYSAFMSVYGIDLETIPYLHWWKFRALFEGLPADTEIKERIYYRSVDLNKVKEKEERKRIKEIKKRITLKDTRRKRKLDDYEIGDKLNGFWR